MNVWAWNALNFQFWHLNFFLNINNKSCLNLIYDFNGESGRCFYHPLWWWAVLEQSTKSGRNCSLMPVSLMSSWEPSALLNLKPLLLLGSLGSRWATEMPSVRIFLIYRSFPFSPVSLCYFLGFLPSGKVLALIMHNNSSPALHFAALENQVRVEAFLSLHLSGEVSPHLSLQIISDYFHQWPWLWWEGCLQCGPEIQRSFWSLPPRGPSLLEQCWEQGETHELFVWGPQRGKCSNLEAVLGKLHDFSLSTTGLLILIIKTDLFISLIFKIFSSKSFLFWRRRWQPTPVFLPRESHGQRSLVGCSPWGHTESDMSQVT